MDLNFFENKKAQLLGVFLIVTLNTTFGKTQVAEYVCDSNAVVTNLLGDNLYGQIGLDMHLQFPKGHNMADVFPKGKSFGVDVAIGKWFSPEFGGRFKIKWNNGILKNDHNSWLQPYGVPGGNHDKGGFMTFIWDIQFNLHNLLGEYDPERTWNLIASPRAGGWLDIGTGKGCPVLGVGVVNTYRLNDRWRLYADIGYNFVASINGVRSGSGHSSNGYAEINVGVEVDLSKNNRFHFVKGTDNQSKAYEINSFWDNCFGQVGIGMSLQNPYGTNFSNVFPNGSTMGVNLAAGKWFTPEAGIRCGINWQNGLIGNGHAYYLDRDSVPGSNKEKRGFVSIYADFFLNLTNIISGYDKLRKWNTIIYPRMGLGVNFSSENKECPILGFGVEETYSISGNTKLYADFSYQVTTSGFHDGKYHTGDAAGLGHNGWFDINVGVQYEFGRNTWYKPGEKRSATHWECGHNWPRFFVNTGASVVFAFGAKTALKAVVKEERPDHSDDKSFPSGHAAMAFAAARSIDKEFRKDCIWIPIAGYAAATAIGVERVVNDKHHWYDVVAGAGIGIGAAELTWWLSDLCFGKGSNVAVGSSGNTVDVAVRW